MSRVRLCLGLVLLVLLAACGTATPTARTPAATPSSQPSQPVPSATGTGRPSPAAGAPVRRRPLRSGERRLDLQMPAAYTPKAPTGVGTDDYRCFLLDPRLAGDQMITGFNVLPGNPDVVHHVILFRVPPGQVRAAEQRDAATPGQGWTCFGDSGLGGFDQSLDDAPWLGAWAPGGREQVYAPGYGESFPAGSRVVMQVHYNLLAGRGPDTSAAELRLAPASSTGGRRITPLLTQLLPAPVELPCRPDRADAKLCSREASMADVRARFGKAAAIGDLLHLLCGPGTPGPVQSCTRQVFARETIRGVAGHMHLLGRSIRIEVNPGTPRRRVLLDVPVWDFDNQGSRPIRPVVVNPGDTIRVTCRHDQTLRDRLPAFAGIPDKYVVWGEGTTDEMCLGLLMVTRP